MILPVRRIALLAVLVAGCGGAAKSAPGPEAPPSGGGEVRQEQQQAPAAGYGQPAPTSAQPGYAQPPPTATDQPQPIYGGETDQPAPTLGQAEFDLDRAATELSSANNDCTLACRALGSMRRSAERICDLNGPGDPGSRCEHARGRVHDAESRVKSGCGGCER